MTDPRFPNDYERVSAHLPDRARTVVVGNLLPYDHALGERVKDSDGVTWRVVADSIRSCPDDDSAALKGTQS